MPLDFLCNFSIYGKLIKTILVRFITIYEGRYEINF